MKYDPEAAPDPSAWRQLDAADRELAVRQYHKHAHQTVGESARTHASIHVIVENQLAEGHPDAAAALDRLMAEGLDRHDAVHAIGSVVAVEIYETLAKRSAHDPARYARNLRELTAAAWRKGAQG